MPRASTLRDLSPRGVTVSVLLRLADMPPSAAALARAAAVLGEAVLATTAGFRSTRGRGRGRRGAHPRGGAGAGGAAVLCPSAGAHRALYDDIAPAERSLAHAAAARLLSAAGAADDHVAAH